MAGATGLEPAASCVTGRRSNQLNYAPSWDTLLLCLLISLGSLSCPPVPCPAAGPNFEAQDLRKLELVANELAELMSQMTDSNVSKRRLTFLSV
jgi:hypothetical protein